MTERYYLLNDYSLFPIKCTGGGGPHVNNWFFPVMPVSSFIKKRNQALKSINPAVSLYENSKIIQKSPSTLYRWSRVDMSTNVQQMCLSLRGKKSSLSPQQRESIKEWVNQRAEDGAPTSAKDIISFISTLTSGCFCPTKGFISKLCKRLKISSKTQKKRNEKQIRPTYDMEVENFCQKIKQLNAKPSV